MRLTIYFDLDHTLLDTEALKHAFAKALRPLGVTEKEFWTAYRRVRQNGAFTFHSFIRHAVRDSKQHTRALRLLTQETKRAARFLYPDVLPFLRLMKKRRVRLILFSYGHPPYIRMKIHSIPGYKTLFDRILITPHERKDRKLPYGGEYAIFIDNRADVLRQYAQRDGMTIFLLSRGKGEGHRSLHSIRKALEKKDYI